MKGRLVLWGARRHDVLPVVVSGQAAYYRGLTPVAHADYMRDLVLVYVPGR